MYSHHPKGIARTMKTNKTPIIVFTFYLDKRPKIVYEYLYQRT